MNLNNQLAYDFSYLADRLDAAPDTAAMFPTYDPPQRGMRKLKRHLNRPERLRNGDISTARVIMEQLFGTNSEMLRYVYGDDEIPVFAYPHIAINIFRSNSEALQRSLDFYESNNRIFLGDELMFGILTNAGVLDLYPLDDIFPITWDASLKSGIAEDFSIGFGHFPSDFFGVDLEVLATSFEQIYQHFIAAVDALR